MGLFSALGTSTEGLRRTHNALDLISQNVANANNPSYVRRTYVSDAGPTGGAVRRELESYIQRQMWRESSSSGYWASQSDVTGQLDQLYGLPGSKSSLSASYDSFFSALQTLRSDPSSTTQQSVLLSNAKILASKVNALSDNIQSIRSGVEEAIGAATIEANQALSKLTDLNKRLGLSGGTPDPTLLDQRDEALASLSSLLDVNITIASDGTATVSTTNGNTLLDATGARTLSFDSRAPLAATSSYNALSTKRSVGTITLSGNGSGTIDLIAAGAFKTGRLGGLIDARDRTLVAAQAQLDDIAAGLASALSDTDRSGTAVAGGFDLDVNGLQPGNRIKLTYRDSSGVDHKVTIVRVEDPSVLPLADSLTYDPDDKVIGISFAGGVAGAQAGLQSALNAIGPGLTVASGTGGALRITASGSASVTSLSARVTATGLTGAGTALPFFVDENGAPFTDSLDSSPQRVGFANRIQVNPALLANSSNLSIYQSPANSAADPTRINDLLNRLDRTGLESSANANLGLGGTTIPISQLIKQTLQTQANDIQRVASLNETQKTVQASLERRFSSVSGVQLDQELSDMTQLQNIYTANARVLSAVKDMFDVLMRM